MIFWQKKSLFQLCFNTLQMGLGFLTLVMIQIRYILTQSFHCLGEVVSRYLFKPQSKQVEAGSKVELPFWLVCELYLRQLVSIRVPPCFDKESKTREEIGADAAHVDLRSRCPYFYELGCKIAPLIGDKTIGPFLLVAFRIRYKEVLIKAHTLTLAVAPKYLTLLTNEEAKLYEAGQSSIAAFKKWRMGGPRLQMAALLGRKRKPTG